MQDALDRLHAAARRLPALGRLAIISRILLALAFVPTGMVKLLGRRFTTMGVDTSIGAFFEAMYQTGSYWRFIGLGQVVAGLLLLIPATSTLGAVLFLPIIANITVLTWAIQFKGTIYITALMLLANLFLVAWDYDRVRAILFAPGSRPAVPVAAPLPGVERAGYLVGTAAGMVVFLATRGFVPMSVVRWLLPVGGAAALLVLAGWVQAARRPALGHEAR